MALDLRGKRVMVMGLGIHGGGLGVTRWLVQQGAEVTVTDLKTAEQLQPTLAALEGLPVRFVLGEHREEDFRQADLIVRNPGVPRESKWLAFAQECNVPVEMEMGLFFQCLPRGAAQVIGITGTKGKTTTTLMVEAIFKRHAPRTVVGGNLRVSALELLDRIDAETPVILELSSWQLEALVPHKVSPRWAAITNISEDHLNRYRDMDDYANAKAIIFRYQQPDDFVVLNFDNPILTRLRNRAFSHVVWFSSRRALNQGACVEKEALVWRWAGQTREIVRLDELQVLGRHNVENALAATALASVWGVPPETIGAALREFRGAEHHLEQVRVLEGVTYINDTTATAPAAAIAALEAVRPSARQIILLAGGADKAMDFREMAQAIASAPVQVILLEGTATDKVQKAIKEQGGAARILGRWNAMAPAVSQARAAAQPGDVVLLSPGAASFGMFSNEFERGEVFKRSVQELE